MSDLDRDIPDLVKDFISRSEGQNLYDILAREAQKNPMAFQRFVEMFSSMVPEIKQHRFIKLNERIILKNANDGWMPLDE